MCSYVTISGAMYAIDMFKTFSWYVAKRPFLVNGGVEPFRDALIDETVSLKT